jgi:hypothetical protein
LPSVQSISHRMADNLGQVIEYIVNRHSPPDPPGQQTQLKLAKGEAVL